MAESRAKIIADDLLEEIPSFENFFEAAGFKRIYGSIYGVLVLAPHPLSSDEIEEALGISQSAVSQTVKVLLHFGVLELEAGPVPRQKLYKAKENSLNIVSSIIRKREQQHIENFRRMSERLGEKLQKHNINDERLKRVESIEATCSIANALIEFIVHLLKLWS
jgi:DNA-binding transcriptional regulator GbsR (MarR family)